LLACHGQIESVMSIPLNDAYTTPRRLTNTVMSLGAGELTVFATIALGGIHGKRLWGHGSVLSHVVGSYSKFLVFSLLTLPLFCVQ
jgi:hypothetical protein